MLEYYIKSKKVHKNRSSTQELLFFQVLHFYSETILYLDVSVFFGMVSI